MKKHIPSRNNMSRSGRTYRILYPSRKMNRMIGCESILERDAVILFEQLEEVESYIEQPVKVVYEHDGTTKNYYPDFLIWVESQPIYVEVKPEKKLNSKEVKGKFISIKKHFKNRKLNFMTLSEQTIRVAAAKTVLAIKINMTLMEG